jgi:hypothetical protein
MCLALPAQRFDGSQHGRAGGQAIVDQNDGRAANLRRGPAGPIFQFPPLQFAAFLLGDSFDRSPGGGLRWLGRIPFSAALWTSEP